MFTWLFKKKNTLKLHVALLQNIFNHLGADFDYIRRQLAEGIIIRYKRRDKPAPGYIYFRHKTDLFSKYFVRLGRHLALRGIYVFDELSGDYAELEIKISGGVLMDYCAVGRLEVKPIVEKIKIENFRVQYLASTADYEQIAHLLTPEEKDLLNPDEVYEVELEGKVYYHLCELGDGDFIGMDLEKRVYVITHDPYKITRQEGSPGEVLKRLEGEIQ